jgi:hypothetical protein
MGQSASFNPRTITLDALSRCHVPQPEHTTVFSPDLGDQTSLGIANDPLQAAASTESSKEEQRGERLSVFHRSSRTTAG